MSIVMLPPITGGLLCDDQIIFGDLMAG